jgi:hypothetical protein
MGNKRDPQPSSWRKPLFIVCMALCMAIPLAYFEGVLVNIFTVSKNESQVRENWFWVASCEGNTGFVPTKCF